MSAEAPKSRQLREVKSDDDEAELICSSCKIAFEKGNVYHQDPCLGCAGFWSNFSCHLFSVFHFTFHTLRGEELPKCALLGEDICPLHEVNDAEGCMCREVGWLSCLSKVCLHYAIRLSVGHGSASVFC